MAVRITYITSHNYYKCAIISAFVALANLRYINALNNNNNNNVTVQCYCKQTAH